MLIPLLVMGTLSIFLIQQYVKESINDDNMNILKQTKENLELIFNELDSLNLYIIASAKEFKNLQRMMDTRLLDKEDHKDLASLKNFIDSPNIARSYIDSIYIYVQNDSGKFISSTTGGLEELDEFSDQSWYESFKKHSGKELTWTEARTINKSQFDKTGNFVNLITMYRKIPENNGVLVLNIKSGYLENRLASLSTTNGQSLFIVDKKNNIIFKGRDYNIKAEEIKHITSQPKSFFTTSIEEKQFVISKIFSSKYGWNYVSISPKQYLYQVPKRLFKIVLILLILCIISSTALALYLTQKMASDIKIILNIFQSAEQGKALPPMPSRVNDVHSYIIHNILKNFMEHNYLKIHLSEQKYKEQAMEFAALQSQLNPHFLFNTLETINWKAIGLTGSPNELNGMIENLAAILRYSLDEENKMVPIMEEIKYTTHYIEIQKIRHKDQFEVIWEFEEDIEKYHVKKLIIQPLIENSLQHGMISGKKCFIKIKIISTIDHLIITVIDNGKGMTEDRLIEVQERLNTSADHSNHIGLINTHKRLKVTYGNEYGLVIQSKCAWGTVIRIVMPK